MKRVIDGKSYNTDTATIVAKWEYRDQDEYDTEAVLYQTRGGAFFAVHTWEVEDRRSDNPVTKTYVEAMTHDEVQRLVERTNGLEIIDTKALDEPPEAEDEPTPGATLYVRLPASLKEQIDAIAAQDRMSINAWATRCLETCIASRKAAA